MKDSKGRQYDGWVLKNSKGRLCMRSFERRRTVAWYHFTLRREKFRRAGWRAVKVRFVEVVE